MQNSKDFIKTHKILGRISFKDGLVHKVKLLQDKEIKIETENQGVVDGIRFLVEEDGEQKTFQTASPYLIRDLAEISENEIVVIQLKRKKTEQGFRSYFEVKKETSEDDGIPVIDDEIFPAIPEEEESF